MQRVASSLLVASFLLLSSRPARAESIFQDLFEIQSNGSLSFYTLSTGTTETSFFVGDSITFSGLSGVDFVSGSPTLTGHPELFDFSLAYTPTTVTLTEIGPLSVGFLYGDYPDLFGIYSTSTTLGEVFYSITGTPEVTGEALGPVATAVTPEPASLVLTGAGLALLLALQLRKKPTAY